MIDTLLSPRSIAVVGATDDTRKLRGKLLHHILAGGFEGTVYPVHPSHAQVQGLRAYPDLASLPAPPDVVLIAVPGAQVPQVIRQAGSAGCSHAIVFTSDADPQAVQQAARDSGIRVLGPNTEGIYVARSRLAATFASVAEHLSHGALAPASKRPVSIVSQSGGLAFAFLGHGVRENLDFHSVVTTGNEGDLETLDFVEHLVEGGEAGVVVMFVEGFKHAARFKDVAALAADRGVPLVVMKIGRSEAGRRAAISHTAHLAGADTAYDAVFERYGVVRVFDLEEMLAAAAAFSRLPPSAGRRTAVVTTSGGAGGWAADLCGSYGIELPVLGDALQQRIGALIPAYGACANPVDATAAAVEDGGATLIEVVQLLVDCDEVDSVIVNMGLAAPGRIEKLRTVLAPMLQTMRKPVLFHSHIAPTPDNTGALAAMGGHAFATLRGAAFALHALARYGAFRQRWGSRKTPAPTAPTTAPPLPTFEDTAGGVLDDARTRALLERFEIPTPPSAVATSADEAMAAATHMGFPVVLKIQSVDIPHKTETGGVALGVTARTLPQAFERILADVQRHAPDARIEGVLVQKMVSRGHEMVVGVVDDADFGPLLMLGLGGIYVEVFKDVAFAPVPLDLDDAQRLIRSLRGSAILFGARGRPSADVDALAGLLVKVSRLAVAGARAIDQLDLNPVIVHDEGGGAVAVDALVAMRPGAQQREP